MGEDQGSAAGPGGVDPLWCHDFDLPLRDALENSGFPPARRALAALAIGTALDEGHLAALELAQAAQRLEAHHDAGWPNRAGEGGVRINTILRAPGDDYQRALWYAVSRLSIEEAVAHLTWLAELMRARAAMFRAIRESGAPMPLLPRGGHDGNAAQLRID